MSPFEPVGEQARWRIIYDMLTKLGPGEVITYKAMAEELDLNATADRHILQMACRRAAKEYEEVDRRALDAVPNVGYRIVEPPEHLDLARRHQKKSSRSLVRGRSKAINVDLSRLDPETRKAFEIVAQAFALQLDFNRRMDVRQKRLEEAVASVSERHDRSAEEIAALRERLERIEAQRRDTPS